MMNLVVTDRIMNGKEMWTDKGTKNGGDKPRRSSVE